MQKYTFVNRNEYGFGRKISATASLKILEIASYFFRFLPCCDKNLLLQNCCASEMKQIACSRGFLLCRHTVVWQREKSENVREMLYFRHIGFPFIKV